MLQQYGRPSGGYDIGGAAGLDFGGGGPSGGDLRATSAGSAFGGGMSQGFQPVRMQHVMASDLRIDCLASTIRISRMRHVWGNMSGSFGYGPLHGSAMQALGLTVPHFTHGVVWTQLSP